MKEIITMIPCHRIPERCLHINGKPMPLCARCFSMMLGYIFLPFAVIFSIKIPIWISLTMALPLLFDGFTQAWKWRKSSNPIRFVTGLCFGIGQSLFISTIVWTMVEKITKP